MYREIEKFNLTFSFPGWKFDNVATCVRCKLRCRWIFDTWIKCYNWLIIDFSCQSVQNLGLAVFNIVAGTIVEHYGYTWVEVFFIGSLSGLTAPPSRPHFIDILQWPSPPPSSCGCWTCGKMASWTWLPRSDLRACNCNTLVLTPFQFFFNLGFVAGLT